MYYHILIVWLYLSPCPTCMVVYTTTSYLQGCIHLHILPIQGCILTVHHPTYVSLYMVILYSLPNPILASCIHYNILPSYCIH